MSTNIYIDRNSIKQVDIMGLNRFNILIHVLLSSHVEDNSTIIKKLQGLHSLLKTVTMQGLNTENSVDFLIYYLAKQHTIESLKNQFIIISKDERIAEICKQLRIEGRKIHRLESLNAANLSHITPNQSFTEHDYPSYSSDKYIVLQNIATLTSDQRPKKITKLKNHIKTVLRCEDDLLRIDAVLSELISDKSITVKEHTVSYFF